MQEHCRRLMILKVVAVIGWRVRKTRKDEIRGRGRRRGEYEAAHVDVPMCYHRGRSAWFVRASMWANNAHFGRAGHDALHSLHYIPYTFSCGRAAVIPGDIPRRRRVLHRGRAAERWLKGTRGNSQRAK